MRAEDGQKAGEARVDFLHRAVQEEKGTCEGASDRSTD